MPETLCKICGLRREEDLRLCHELGVGFTGFIFARQSPRFVEPEAVAALPVHYPDSPAGRPLRVGVFAGESLDEIRRVASTARLDLLQLHGGEDENFCRALRPERVIKVLWPQRLGRQGLEDEMRRFAPVCAWFLLDAGQSGGGSGGNLDWRDLAELRPPRPWLLAGGLGPDSLPLALAACSPAGVDLNSALESAPGEKDHARMRAAVAIVKGERKNASGGLRGVAP